jgi:hypothetical protein
MTVCGLRAVAIISKAFMFVRIDKFLAKMRCTVHLVSCVGDLNLTSSDIDASRAGSFSINTANLDGCSQDPKGMMSLHTV